jgi:ribosomal protein L37E
MLLQWANENINGLIAGLSMALALVVTIKRIYRDHEKERIDIERSQTHFLYESFDKLLEDKLRPRYWYDESDRMVYKGGRLSGGRTAIGPLTYLRNTITSGSCAIQVYPQSEGSLAYRRRVEGSWDKKPNEPLRLFCSSCNGYTYNDSHGSCINCGHVREKVIEPIYSKERT